ncbi:MULTISPECIES: site-specific integrase [Halorubrum]|uniref:site-specific integrase n=1 Tax=Halorubrum TaxID=56688 RepID=UPI0009B5B26F|nr:MULTISPECIES: site-specific integrase [Halorubrum]
MVRGDDPDHKLRKEKDRIRGCDSLSETETEAALEFIRAFDPQDIEYSCQDENGETQTLSHNSLEGYGRSIRLLAKESDASLFEHTLETLTDVFNDWLDELAIETVRQRQAAVIKFHRYHETDVDPDEISLKQRENDTSVDERDMFDADDVQAIRDACDNARDRCLIELLLYTGQRIRAIQTLRIKDIDLEEGAYYLNTDADGLKGADDVGRKRPLLGAENAVRDWIDKHPTGERDDYLITPLPSARNISGKGEYLSTPAIHNRLSTIVERAGVEKPSNAHNFRHLFVTNAVREYDLDPSTIKHLIGHQKDSVVMETTYQHLTDEDHIRAAREGSDAGRDPEPKEGSLTPETCPTCSEPLPPAAKACSRCGQVFAPDARAAKETVENVVHEGAKAAESDAEREAIDAVRGYLKENPEVAAENPELVKQLLGEE